MLQDYNEEFVEKLISDLKEQVRKENLCVFPDKQTFDCCDCTLCQLDFFDKVRQRFS